jgi:hypothetical protein
MNKAALDTLYNHLMDTVTDGVDIGRISTMQAVDITHELFDARWCSDSDDDANNSLRALAFHHNIPLPNEIDLDGLDKLLRQSAEDDDE